MVEIANLGYVVLGVRDLPRWKDFANVLGFQVGRSDADLLTLRMDQYQQRIVLERGEEDDLRVAGWELDTEEDLETYVSALRARGLTVAAGAVEEAERRCVQRLFCAEDANGFQHEFYCGPTLASTLSNFRSPALISGFRTDELGIGHVVVHSRDYQQSVDFYRKVMGLRLSDRIRDELAPGRVVDVTFLHTRTGRHHSLATGVTPGPKILNHMMVEVQSMDDVGLAYDRCIAAGYSMHMEIGHHPNDKMFSFYVVTPSGFAVEFGWGGVVIDDKTWQAVMYDKLSDWGHKRKPPVARPT